jgi:predicted chitinase
MPVAAQAAPPAQPAAPAQPPTDNVFPVPLPYEVSFSDSWHACRDGCARQHKGNDLMADEGAPAVAVEAGVIAKVDDTDDGNGGLTVWLRGDSGVAYYYAHNAENLVSEGQRVGRGQMIARVGRTGNARTTPPHIHFQINLCGETSSDEPCTVNPYPYLRSWAQGAVDGGADGVGWYEASRGTFGQRNDVGSPLPAFPFGTAGAAGVVPLAGDWDGDGRDSVGVYQRADATFSLRDDEGVALEPVVFGEPGRADVWPIAGDFDGDGRDTVGLYRRTEGVFVALVDQGVESAPVAVGTPGRSDTLPVAGDWDGDGRDSVGVYQQAGATVTVLDDEGAALAPTAAGTGGAGTYPVAGDWDGDGRDSVGLLRRDAATFELPVPNALDPAAVRTIAMDGGPDALPVAGDWNGRDLVTIEELRQIYGTMPDEATVIEGLSALNAHMRRAGISTPARKAAFIATLRSESGLRYDAVEGGSDERYRGRGFIQLTGDFNYEAAGEFLEVDLLGEPDLATGPLVSPAVAAWYWTVARNINAAADQLDMAAVNIAIGFAPSAERDMVRCSDFMAALRYYGGDTAGEGANCERTAASHWLAFSSMLPFASGGGRGAPSDGAAAGPSSPAGEASGTSAPTSPSRPGSATTGAPTTGPSATTGPSSTGTTPTTGPSTTGTTSTPTTGPSTTSTAPPVPTTGSSTTGATSSPTTAAAVTTPTTSPVDPDGALLSTLFDAVLP